MKLSRLFVLSALCLTGMSVNAVELEPREAPTPEKAGSTPVAFEVGKTYILYNTGAEMYFTQGSTWSTRGCVVPNKASAVAIRVAKYTVSDVWDGKTYEIQNYVTNRTSYSWYKLCMNTGGDLYLDQTSWARFLEIKDQGSNVYRLMPSEENANVTDYETVVSDGTQFIGYDGLDYDGSNDTAGFDDASERYPLSALTTENVDWVFYDYSAFDAYEKAEELRKLIEGAGDGINVDNAITVYNNLSSTVAELQAAIDALNDAIAQGTFAGFTPGTALDITSLLVNPDFTGGDTSGWDGTGWGHGNSNDNVEHYNKTYDTYQTVSGLRAGLYVVGMNGFYRAGSSQESYDKGKANNDDVRNATFYATIGDGNAETPVEQIYSGIQTESRVGGEATVTDGDLKFYQPNNGTSADYYFHTLGLYKNLLFATLPSAGQMTIGVKKDIAISTDWSIFDDFTLVYCGEGAQAYQAYVNYYKNTFPDYESLRVDAEYPFTLTDGVNVSDVVLNEFKSVSATATDEASARAALQIIDQAFEPVRLNVSLWAEFLETAKTAAQQVGDNESLDRSESIVAEVGDWGKFFAAEEWDAREMTNEELRARIDEMNGKIAEAKLKLKHEGYETVATNLLTNPDFTGNANGWTDEHVSGGNVRYGENCYEAWNNANFDIYQVVKNAPEGVYRIEVQGFYRYLRGDNAWNAYQAQESQYVKPGGAPVFVYMNQKTTPFKNVFDEKQPVGEVYKTAADAYTDPNGEYWYPDQMTTSSDAFVNGMYKQSAYGIIRAGQDMRIGVKGVSNQGGDSWVIFDNFNLFNCGKDETALNTVLPDEIEKAKAMLTNEDGTQKLMGKDIHAALEKAIADAESALGTTGEAMFDALNDLFDAEENVNASVELFATLAAANDKLMKTIELYGDSPAADEAGALYEEILTDLGEYKYNDSDVAGLIAKINAMMTKLRMPDVAGASASTPIDITVVVNNFDYGDEAGTASSDGWSGTAAGTNAEYFNAEVFNTTPFDHYQEIVGLPAGVYRVTVKGFYRFGFAADDYAAYNEDASANNNAKLYGTTDGGTWSIPMHRLATFASTDYADMSDYVEVEEGSGLWVPNMMSTASELFEAVGEEVDNTITVALGEGKTLRLGIKKDEGMENDWCLFDTWKLEYLGTDTSIVPATDGKPGDVNGDGEVDVADISSILTIMAS
ncbi:MAG: hypothetical protein J6Z14_04065, partial [Prevotella sp.]|nr:hypothetical protein [Prevotella sp.]